MKKRRKGPRPLPESRKRVEQIRILLTAHEKAVIERAAELREMGLAEYCRTVIMPDAERTLAEHDE